MYLVQWKLRSLRSPLLPIKLWDIIQPMPFPIERPKVKSGNSDYGRQCAQALDLSVRNLMSKAVASGWDEVEVALQVIWLCESYIYGPFDRER